MTLAFLIVGCGDSREQYVFTGTNNPTVTGNTLTVNLDTAAPVNGRIAAVATRFEVALYDANLTAVSSQTLNRGQSATFTGLPDGTYTVRVIGRDSGGATVGYFDKTFTLTADGAVFVDGLIYTCTLSTHRHHACTRPCRHMNDCKGL